MTVWKSGADSYERTHDLELAGAKADTKHLNGPRIKHSGEYSIRVATADEELVLANHEITDRLENSDLGSNCAQVKIIVTEQGGLESQVSLSEYC